MSTENDPIAVRWARIIDWKRGEEVEAGRIVADRWSLTRLLAVVAGVSFEKCEEE